MSTGLRRTTLISVLFLFITGVTFGAEGPLRLQNAQLTVSFGERGVQAVSDQALKKTFALAQDDFAITVGGKVIRSEMLAKPTVKRAAGAVTYTFQASPYTVLVEYELQPTWRFVSKQIVVTAADGEGFVVNRVTPMIGKLTAVPNDVHIAQSRWRREGNEKDYGVFFRYGTAGLMVLVQNPFLKIEHNGGDFSLAYSPTMEWRPEYNAPFPADRVCLGTYAMSGNKVPTHQIAEWKLDEGKALAESPTLDEAEIEAFVNCVRAFVLERRKTTTKINVAWTENDYQIDVATTEGRAEYKRIIDRAAELGLEHMVFGPGNSELALAKDDTDSWHWEHILWLGLGQKIRRGEWDVATGAIPASVQEMLDYARSRNVRLMAYVYPVLPFQQNRKWLVGEKKDAANIGNREFQDFLIKSLVTFARRTGISGYAFDYTWLALPGYSEYAQWWGWKRVIESLRAQIPDIIMDGRQGYQQLGPWTWLAGSYPHPTSTDEQAESFTPFPDLHFDRVSADRERITAYRYRVNDFCPPELMPGFIGHQTERYDEQGEQVNGRYRVRDWDYLGWRYSLLSSIAVAGLHNVMSMIPARDESEYRLVSERDKEFFRQWLRWTDANRAYLLNARFILGQPAIGKVDGTSAIVGSSGYLFLFNPNARKMTAELRLDSSIGLNVEGSYLLREIYPEAAEFAPHTSKAGASGPPREYWDYGDHVSIPLDGGSVRVLQIGPVPHGAIQPLIVNGSGQARFEVGKLALENVRGEVGSTMELQVWLPRRERVGMVTVNGKQHKFVQRGDLVTVPVQFAGAAFSHMQQVGHYDPNFAGGTYSATFTVPQRVFQQLRRRQQEYPIPWTPEDLKTTWLAPQRLLLFIQLAEPSSDMALPQLELDGKPVVVAKAYSSVRRNPRSIVGYYADLSSTEPNREHRLRLTLPPLRPGQFQGMFFENVETEYTEQVGAN